MKQKELTKPFMMILNLKKIYLVPMVYTQIRCKGLIHACNGMAQQEKICEFNRCNVYNKYRYVKFSIKKYEKSVKTYELTWT